MNPFERNTLWAALTETPHRGEPRRVMAALATYDTYAEAVEAWNLADARRLAGRCEAKTPDGTQVLEYLAVRYDGDSDWLSRPRTQVPPGRWTALLAREGDAVWVRIYNRLYRGRVAAAHKLTAEVTFHTATEPRVRTMTFKVLPAGIFERGLHGRAS